MKRTLALSIALLAAPAFAADITATTTVSAAHQARAIAAVKAKIATAENPTPSNAEAQAWLNDWMKRALTDLTLKHERDLARAAADASVTPIAPN